MKQKLFIVLGISIIFALLLPLSGLTASGAEGDAAMLSYLPLITNNFAPVQPFNPFPADGSVEQSRTVILSWESSDPDGDAITFDVYFEANNPSPALVSSAQAELAYDPGELAYSTPYYWQIIARDSHGAISASPVWHFVTTAPEGMVYIPEGEFLMGCHGSDPVKCDDNEEPLHAVYLDAYFIDKYEVTNAEYAACVNDGGCTLPFDLTRYSSPSYADHPIIYVDLYQAEAYCTWNNQRLLTEAEWEKAARGTNDKRPYPWGFQDITCNHANFYMHGQGYCVGDTTPVGSYPGGVSPYGVFDMIGNAWEWVSDRYEATYYEWSPYRNPQGPPPANPDLPRMARGGCWRSYDFTNRVADRTGHYYPDNLGEDINFFGIRCGQSIP